MAFKISFGDDKPPQGGEAVTPPAAPDPNAAMGSKKQRSGMMLLLGGVLVTVLLISKTCTSPASDTQPAKVAGPAGERCKTEALRTAHGEANRGSDASL